MSIDFFLFALPMKISHLHREFKTYALIEREIMPKSYKAIIRGVHRLCMFAGTELISQLDTKTIRGYLVTSRKEKQWSAKTYRNQWQFFKTYFDWCIKNGYTRKNPVNMIDRPKLASIQPRCISSEDAKKVLFHSSSFPWRSTFQLTRNHAIISTFMMTGVRLQELLNLQIHHIDFERGFIFIQQGKGRKDRHIPIYPRLRGSLNAYCFERGQAGKNQHFLFTGLNSDKQLCPRDIYKICREISKSACVKFTPHMLRHTFARELADDDFDIMKLKEIMGHAHVTTTQRYIALTQRRIKISFEKARIY